MTGANALRNNCLRMSAEAFQFVCLTSGCWCGCVQIVRLDRTMEQIVFPVPNICEFLTQESKLRVYYTTERDEQGSKINDFFLSSEDLFNEMNWQKKLRGTQEATGNTNTVPCTWFSSTFYLFALRVYTLSAHIAPGRSGKMYLLLGTDYIMKLLLIIVIRASLCFFQSRDVYRAM